MDRIILARGTENYITFIVLISFKITTDSMKMLFGIWNHISVSFFQ